MSTDAFEQLIDVAAPGGGSSPVQRGHRRGVRSPHTFDASRWPASSLTSPYAPQGSTTAVLVGSQVLIPRLIRPIDDGGGCTSQFGAREAGADGVGPAARSADVAGRRRREPCRSGRQRCEESEMSGLLEQKKALVTGGSRGIGREIVRNCSGRCWDPD